MTSGSIMIPISLCLASIILFSIFHHPVITFRDPVFSISSTVAAVQNVSLTIVLNVSFFSRRLNLQNQRLSDAE